MSATFTVAAIAAVLGNDLYQPKQQGKDAIQVNLDTRSPANGGPSDGKRCRLLIEGCDKLKEAGYYVEEDESIRLSAPPTQENPNWRPWPSIWVNRNPRPKAVAGGEAVIPVSSVAGLLAAMGISKEQMADALARQAVQAELKGGGTVTVATPPADTKQVEANTPPADAGAGKTEGGTSEESGETPF